MALPSGQADVLFLAFVPPLEDFDPLRPTLE
jgi:hypothetical protein